MSACARLSHPVLEHTAAQKEPPNTHTAHATSEYVDTVRRKGSVDVVPDETGANSRGLIMLVVDDLVEARQRDLHPRRGTVAGVAGMPTALDLRRVSVNGHLPFGHTRRRRTAKNVPMSSSPTVFICRKLSQTRKFYAFQETSYHLYHVVNGGRLYRAACTARPVRGARPVADILCVLRRRLKRVRRVYTHHIKSMRARE